MFSWLIGLIASDPSGPLSPIKARFYWIAGWFNNCRQPV
jgi:hypothetical protein